MAMTTTMKTEYLLAEPVARCKLCGSPEIVAVCHHCAATLCRDHAVVGARRSDEFWVLPRIPARGWSEEPIHCVDCTHRPASGFHIAGLLLIAAGPVLLALRWGHWWLWAIALIVAAICLYLVWRWAPAWPRHHRRPERCPVVPEISNERIVETYDYRSVLSPTGTWDHDPVDASGHARAQLRFTPDDQLRVERFANRTRRVGDSSEVDAGFVVLELRPPEAVDGINIANPATSDARERYVAERLLLPGVARLSQPWELPLHLRTSLVGKRVPAQVFPALTPGTDRQVLGIHLTWPETRSPADLWVDRQVSGLTGQRPVKIELLEVHLPDWLGAISRIDGDPVIETDPAVTGAGHQTIRWEHVAIQPQETAKCLRFHVEHPIPTDLVIEGDVHLAYERSATGLRGMTWFDPLGRPLKSPQYDDAPSATTVKTLVRINFEFAMDTLGYHDELVQAEKAIDLPSKVLTALAPDHVTAIAIARELTDAGLTISHIRESAFTPSDRIGEDNRVWVLRGRYFQGSAPLDFEITLHGGDLHRRMRGSAETWYLTEVTVAGRASFDTPTTRTGFQNGLDEVESRTRAALLTLAGQAPPPSTLAGGGGGAPPPPERPGRSPAGPGDTPDPTSLSEPPHLPTGIGIDDLLSESGDTAGVGDTLHGPPPRPPRSSSGSSSPELPYDTANHHQERVCSVCGKADEQGDYAVCHHCGRLLCLGRRCSFLLHRDHAFTRGLDRLGTSAHHCESCLRQFHPILGRMRLRR